MYIKSLMKKPGKSTLLMAMDESAAWGIDHYLAARISDAMELSNYLFIQANSGEGSDMPLPTPIQRPGEPEPASTPSEPTEFASGQEVAHFFSNFNSL
ncbi:MULTISPECIES: hypothetical protein [unclassified Streptomyces]|uniref:hypothetical protein n=1 Tax=unclassified Streptomyces TaxID=2593676 RepID=UPI000AEB5C94|nr:MULTISPECIES: hypothetical protein [unclassified Streptomyces]